MPDFPVIDLQGAEPGLFTEMSLAKPFNAGGYAKLFGRGPVLDPWPPELQRQQQLQPHYLGASILPMAGRHEFTA